MRRLKVPLWINLIYYGLIAVVPIVITYLELFSTKSSIFTWGIASVSTLLVVLILFRNLVLHKAVTALKSKIASLEHDYSIKVGDENLIRLNWKWNNLKLYLYHAIILILSAGLLFMFITAVANGLMAFRGASLVIFISVTIGCIFKAATFLTFRKVEVTDE